MKMWVALSSSSIVLAIFPLTAIAGDMSAAASVTATDCRGTICISKAYQATIESYSLMSPPASNRRADPEAVDAMGVKISFISSDVLKSWNPSSANKFCAAAGCIYYLKTCHESSCDYTYGNYTPEYSPGMVPTGRTVLFPGNMPISYTKPEALQAAERNVFLALGPDGNKTFVPLSEVNAAKRSPP
jgi:hypothetical protein